MEIRLRRSGSTERGHDTVHPHVRGDDADYLRAQIIIRRADRVRRWHALGSGRGPEGLNPYSSRRPNACHGSMPVRILANSSVHRAGTFIPARDKVGTPDHEGQRLAPVTARPELRAIGESASIGNAQLLDSLRARPGTCGSILISECGGSNGHGHMRQCFPWVPTNAGQHPFRARVSAPNTHAAASCDLLAASLPAQMASAPGTSVPDRCPGAGACM